MAMNLRLSGMAHLRRLILWIGIAISGISFPSIFAYAFGLRVNTSRSLPMGLYVITDNEIGSLIEFCPEGKAAEESKTRRYRSTGSCPDNSEPLIKPVIAREGDLVEMSVKGISVNGNLLKDTAPLREDWAGRPLTSWQFGTYRVAPGEAWVASTYNYGSYDSRYFGPIRISSIRHRLRPIWTLHQ
jgi:conjugative transfer signal peptidase TraF